MYVCVYIYIYIYIHELYVIAAGVGSAEASATRRMAERPNNNDNKHVYGRFPKFHLAFLGRDSGTLKSDIVSNKQPQLICSDLRLSN